MSQGTLNDRRVAQWKIAAGAGFAMIWAVLGSLIMPVEGQGIVEDAPTFAGRVMGQGITIGLIAALVAHILVLRQTSRKTKVLVYLAAAILGAITSWMVNG